jgi:hypothetical protein
MKRKFILRSLGGVIGLGFIALGFYFFKRYGLSIDLNSVSGVSAIVGGLFFVHYAFTGRSLRFTSGRHARHTTKR